MSEIKVDYAQIDSFNEWIESDKKIKKAFNRFYKAAYSITRAIYANEKKELKRALLKALDKGICPISNEPLGDDLILKQLNPDFRDIVSLFIMNNNVDLLNDESWGTNEKVKSRYSRNKTVNKTIKLKSIALQENIAKDFKKFFNVHKNFQLVNKSACQNLAFY